MAAITTPSLEEMDKIGEAAEQEYEAELTDDANATLSVPGSGVAGCMQCMSKPKRIRLSTGQRMRLVEDFRKGKLDKYYSVTIDKKRPGEFRITKRRKPLDTPEIEVTAAPDNIVVPPATTTQIPVVEPPKSQPTKPAPKQDKPVSKPDKVNIEFYAMQNNINNSLTREIQAVMEKCNKIERKMKEQRAEAKSKRKAQPEPEIEYEYEYSDGEPDTAARTCLGRGSPATESCGAAEQPQPPKPQYRMFNARSRINLLRDFR